MIDLQHIPKYIRNGKLLDVGCSWGGYLLLMRSLGWNVFGVEMNNKAAFYAKEELGFVNVRNAVIDSFPYYADNFFDVVNMSMVLEHLFNPCQTLAEVNRIMKADGTLIISVPDLSGFEATLYKDKSYTLQVPQHFTHFTPKILKKMLRSSGFEVEKIIHHKFDRDVVASAGYLKNQVLAAILHNRLVRKTVVKTIVNVLSFIGKTSRMTVYARKAKKNG